MTAEHEERKRTPTELRARLVGKQLEHDREEIRHWQTASEQERGRALYQVLALAGSIMAATHTVYREPNMLILKQGTITIRPRE